MRNKGSREGGKWFANLLKYILIVLKNKEFQKTMVRQTFCITNTNRLIDD